MQLYVFLQYGFYEFFYNLFHEIHVFEFFLCKQRWYREYIQMLLMKKEDGIELWYVFLLFTGIYKLSKIYLIMVLKLFQIFCNFFIKLAFYNI